MLVLFFQTQEFALAASSAVASPGLWRKISSIQLPLKSALPSDSPRVIEGELTSDIQSRPHFYVESKLTDRIFKSDLNKELMQKYKEKFGDLQQQRAGLRWSAEVRGSRRHTTEEERKLQRDQQEYGQYMFLRIFEYHISAYSKKDEELRRIWDFKDKLSHYQIKTEDGGQLSAQLRLSDRSFELKWKSGLTDWTNRLRFKLRGLQVEDVIFNLEKRMLNAWMLESQYRLSDSSLSFGLEKTLPRGVRVKMMAMGQMQFNPHLDLQSLNSSKTAATATTSASGAEKDSGNVSAMSPFQSGYPIQLDQPWPIYHEDQNRRSAEVFRQVQVQIGVTCPW